MEGWFLFAVGLASRSKSSNATNVQVSVTHRIWVTDSLENETEHHVRKQDVFCPMSDVK